MMYENTGRLFKNTRKTKDNQPDYTGDFTDANGVKMRVAAWLKDGRDGKYMSFKVSEDTREPATSEDALMAGQESMPEDDERLPF